jgi:hypothetical protein
MTEQNNQIELDADGRHCCLTAFVLAASKQRMMPGAFWASRAIWMIWRANWIASQMHHTCYFHAKPSTETVFKQERRNGRAGLCLVWRQLP